MNDSTCAIDGCEKPLRRKSGTLCSGHLQRLKRHGDVQADVPLIRVIRADALTRFEGRVAVMPSGCHEWTGAKLKDGYGSFQFERHGWPAHRWIWIQKRGPIPRGNVVRHKCDNPPCVNLDHLELGTVKQNQDDMVSRGRSLKGSKNAIAKLDEEKVREIRIAVRDKTSTQLDLARKHGVTPPCINAIIVGRAWKHVTIEAA